MQAFSYNANCFRLDAFLKAKDVCSKAPNALLSSLQLQYVTFSERTYPLNQLVASREENQHGCSVIFTSPCLTTPALLPRLSDTYYHTRLSKIITILLRGRLNFDARQPCLFRCQCGFRLLCTTNSTVLCFFTRRMGQSFQRLQPISYLALHTASSSARFQHILVNCSIPNHVADERILHRLWRFVLLQS